jgi:hypothetical protein
MANQAACCTWRGVPRWQQLATAYWGGGEHCSPAKLKRYRCAFAVLSPQCTLVCLLSTPEQLRWGLFYALVAKRLVHADVHLVVTHHCLFTQMQVLLGELQCPRPYSVLTEMIPLHLLPLEYLYLSAEFPRASRLHVWCDTVGWAAVRLLRPRARRWFEAASPSSCVEMQPERGHWRWLLHDASAL